MRFDRLVVRDRETGPHPSHIHQRTWCVDLICGPEQFRNGVYPSAIFPYGTWKIDQEN